MSPLPHEGPIAGVPVPPGAVSEPGQNDPVPAEEAPSIPGVALNGKPVHSRLVRLTHEQWEHSVRDLLRLDADPGLSSSFTSDPPNGTFSNNERALIVTPNLRLDYQLASEELSERIARDPEALARVFPQEDSAEFISAFGRRAYRRNLTAEELANYQALFDQGASVFESGDARADGAELVIEAFLQSPFFVYRTELGDDGERLSGFEIASKLSFLLRNTTPDDDLLDAAAAGDLDEPEAVVELARRMVDAPEAAAVIARYHGELFGIDRYSSIAKDEELFPEHEERLNAALASAEERFLDDIFQQGLGLKELLTSTTAYANEELAPLYGAEVTGEELQPIDVGADRPGLFTRLGFLAYNGTLRDPDSIHRGVEINRNILCTELEPPAGVIPALPTIQPDQTNRERVNAHTGPGTCGEGCHATLINPIGFAFENFDALGQLRDTDNGKPVDTTGAYRFADGLKEFDGAAELMGLIAESPQAHACYARHVAEFVLGRDVERSDDALVDEVQLASWSDEQSIKELLIAVVANPAFGRRSPLGGTP